MTLWMTCPYCGRRVGIKGHITFGGMEKNEFIKKICRCKGETKKVRK